MMQLHQLYTWAYRGIDSFISMLHKPYAVERSGLVELKYAISARKEIVGKSQVTMQAKSRLVNIVLQAI